MNKALPYSRLYLKLLRRKTATMSTEELLTVDYEVYGKVQGVYFSKIYSGDREPRKVYLRLYSEAEGQKLGLVGWVQNTSAGTVQGQLQGPASKVRQMQEWLKTTGSPKSRIIKAEFTNEKQTHNMDFKDFKVVR